MFSEKKFSVESYYNRISRNEFSKLSTKVKRNVKIMKFNFEKIVSYIDNLYENDEAFKKTYIEQTDLKKFGNVVDSDVSRMVQLIIRLVRPQRILEIGTSIGYSTISMANIAQEYGGKITTIEFNERSAHQAIKNFQQAGVAELIEVITGDAQDIIPTLNESYDLIFQDVGDKTLYPVLLNDLITLLRPGGVLLAEDTLFPVMNLNVSEDSDDGRQMKKACESIDEFNMMITHSPSLQSTILPLGDGLTIGIKTG
jgi:predicted O-methyltransferase YrrM